MLMLSAMALFYAADAALRYADCHAYDMIR